MGTGKGMDGSPRRVGACNGRALDATIVRGAAAYDRARMLPRLLPLAAVDLVGDEPGLTRRIVRLLARALRAERSRGRAGHWTYDLNRHIGLRQAYIAELARLADAARGTRPLS